MKTAATVLSLCLMMSFTAWSQATSNSITGNRTSKVSKTSEVGVRENDTIAVLNAEQLRTTALIFAEHKFLKKENALLKEQAGTLQQSLTESERMITDYRAIIQKLETNRTEADRIRESITDSYKEQLRQQKKKNRRRTILCTAGGIAAGLIIGGIVFN